MKDHPMYHGPSGPKFQRCGVMSARDRIERQERIESEKIIRRAVQFKSASGFLKEVSKNDMLLYY